jgi:hypothetical protein
LEGSVSEHWREPPADPAKAAMSVISGGGYGVSAAELALVAASLERLAARISRDLDVDAGEGVPPEDPAWAETIAGVAGYARECVAVLDDPRISAVLAARSDASG